MSRAEGHHSSESAERRKKFAIAALWVVLGLCLGGMTYTMLVPHIALALVPVVLCVAIAQLAFHFTPS
jgi:hypothetical protein